MEADKKTIYNLFGDYPDNMTPEQIAIVKAEMPYWADFFEVRTSLLYGLRVAHSK